MAYEAKRRKLYEEEFLLTEEDGTVVHKLHVSLDADSMVKKLSEKYVALLNAYQQVQTAGAMSAENIAERLEFLGNTVVDMLEAVFGDENTKIIVEFYDSRYIEMCKEVMPFITEAVIPQIRKIAADNRKQTLSKYQKKKSIPWTPRRK